MEPVPGYPGWFATFVGQIVRFCVRRLRWVVAKRATPSDSGYERVVVYGRKVRLHRLVLLAYAGPPPSPRHHGAHLDGDKSNNLPTNLAWKTPEENEADKRAHGTAPRGGRTRNVSPQLAGKIRAAGRRGESVTRIARRHGLHRKTVARYLREPA